MVVVKNRFVVLEMVFSRVAEFYSIVDMLLDLISLVFKSKYQHVSPFPIYEVCAIVQDELIYCLNTGENSCLKVTKFSPRSMESKDDACAVGKGDLLSEGWHCSCF